MQCLLQASGVHIRLMVSRGLKPTPYQNPRTTIGAPTIVIVPEWKEAAPGTAPLADTCSASSSWLCQAAGEKSGAFSVAQCVCCFFGGAGAGAGRGVGGVQRAGATGICTQTAKPLRCHHAGPKEQGISLFTCHVVRGPSNVQDPTWNSHSKLNCIAACIQVSRWCCMRRPGGWQRCPQRYLVCGQLGCIICAGSTAPAHVNASG